MLVPNDVYCSDSTAFQILQGPKLVLCVAYAPADIRVIACLVGSWSLELYSLSLFTLLREKHVPQTGRLADYHGAVWFFCPGRVCKFSVRVLPNLRHYSSTNNHFLFLSIHAHLLTRLSNDDDIEKSLSTFANEMASSAMILGLASSESLILIDELGRATSPKEGLGISHAIAEELIKLNVSLSHPTLVLTHVL